MRNRTAEGNTPDGVQQRGLGLRAAGPGVGHNPRDPVFRERGRDVSGCDGVDADACGAELGRESLAIAAQRCLRGAVGGRGLVGPFPLERRNVDDSARSLLDHARKDHPVQPHGRQQVRAEGPHPVLVGQPERAARPGKGRPDAVHDDIQATKHLGRLAGNQDRSLG